jgi:uncharacterized protein (DUF2147 family)
MNRNMKFFFAVVCFLFVFTILVDGARVHSNSILGEWIDHDKVHGDSIIQILEINGRFFGKIVGMRDEKQVDEENPDSSKRTLPLLGRQILKDFTFANGEWSGGTIYDPKNGKTYSCKMWLETPKVLKIRGYLGISLFGITNTWTRKE